MESSAARGGGAQLLVAFRHADCVGPISSQARRVRYAGDGQTVTDRQFESKGKCQRERGKGPGPLALSAPGRGAWPAWLGYPARFQVVTRSEKVMHAEETRPSCDPDGTRPSTSITPNVLTAVSATSALDARRWHLVRVRRARCAKTLCRGWYIVRAPQRGRRRDTCRKSKSGTYI